jgi:AraC-like DNA-binding protein
MLTAKATSKDKISGLETGADDYIVKPFEAQELKARIRNLLEQRRRLQEHFWRYGLVDMAGQNITSVDQRFLQKAVEVVTEHIADTSFGVEEFADLMAVSRSLLFRKMEALLGEPPSEFIKRTRLSRAAQLIESKTGNVSEIALEVGFNNPSYFAECFRKQFGQTPTQYSRRSKQSPSEKADSHSL